ncbi:MAG TPA: non-homologous end-joining DNA ligase [Anaerolineae bacterium]|nr:non-homologous end-joining DNA ligase [Anaerolineae bacterium]
MALEEYKRKRNFERTREPRGKVEKSKRHRFVVQEHHASRLHFDFRLEMAGVLKSWAVPKGPSMDPRDKRLAVEVEDHPVSYIDFEGEIAEGNYGAGQVRIWDNGTYELVEPFDPLEQLDSGKLSFILHGKKLRGEFTLVKLANRDKQWLLIKKDDAAAKSGWKLETVLKDDAKPRSTRTRKRTTRTKQASENESEPERENAADEAVDEDDGVVRGKDTLRYKKGGKSLTIKNVERAKMPSMIEPMLATLVNKPFVDADWIFETKWDGVRAVCFIENGKMRLVSRSQQDITFRYPELKDIPKSVRADRAILDGEIVVLDEKGVARFQLLQQRIGIVEEADIRERAKQYQIIYYVFDLLHYDDYNLMPADLIDRKKLLKAILKTGHSIQFSKHTVRDGIKALKAAERKRTEGIVAKHKRSPYVQRRSSRWLKIKTMLRQEVVIGGYTQPKGSREYFGALVVGLYRGNELQYVGNVGGGFNRKSLKQMYDLLQKYKTKRSPFADGTQPNERVQWVEPKLVGEVKFAEWTSDKRMRMPIFMGLRDDKDPKQVHFEYEKDTKRQVKKAEKADRAR